METTIAIFLSSVLLFISSVLVMVLMEQRKSRKLLQSIADREEQIDFISFQMNELLTTIRWHSEMLMGQEFGKLKISQVELLDKIVTSIEQAIPLMHNYVKPTKKQRKTCLNKCVDGITVRS